MDNLEGALTPRVFTEGVESGYGGNPGAEVNVQGVEESKFAVADVDVDVDVDGMEDDAGGGRCQGVERLRGWGYPRARGGLAYEGRTFLSSRRHRFAARGP